MPDFIEASRSEKTHFCPLLFSDKDSAKILNYTVCRFAYKMAFFNSLSPTDYIFRDLADTKMATFRFNGETLHFALKKPFSMKPYPEHLRSSLPPSRHTHTHNHPTPGGQAQ
jgi:hypothetical protein